LLDRHDRLGARRQRRTGRDADRAVRLERVRRRRARARLAGDPQRASIALLAKRGTSPSAWTGTASTLPSASASATATVSAGRGEAAASTSSRACSSGIGVGMGAE
jgi:hypothetical protein